MAPWPRSLRGPSRLAPLGAPPLGARLPLARPLASFSSATSLTRVDANAFGERGGRRAAGVELSRDGLRLPPACSGLAPLVPRYTACGAWTGTTAGVESPLPPALLSRPLPAPRIPRRPLPTRPLPRRPLPSPPVRRPLPLSESSPASFFMNGGRIPLRNSPSCTDSRRDGSSPPVRSPARSRAR